MGVRTLDFVNPGQLDVLHVTDGQAATYDRPLTVEVWYPAAAGTDTAALTRHNIAPNPPPPESLAPGLDINEYYRYAEPAWDERRINNINQHFVTAFLGTHLQGKDYGKYLELKEDSNEETWTGFVPRSSIGLELLHAAPE